MKSIEERAQKLCRDFQTKGVFRRLPPDDAHLRLNLASNDYLGIVRRGLLRPSLTKHASRCGTGGGSSRLVFGNTRAHRILEEKLADHFEYEAALVFTSGFMANYGLCSALRELADVVLIDKRVHASVVDGLMQSMGGKCEIKSFKHNDAEHYRHLSERFKGREMATITESLFSMTGRVCNRGVIEEAGQRGFLIVDEAHSLGAVKSRGKAIFGKAAGADITIGTFGKAFGCVGGFILCSAPVHTFLVNRCRSFIFTTALPEVYAAVGTDAIDLVAGMDEEREKLAVLANYLRTQLISSGFRVSGDAHILAIYCKGAEEAVEISRRLGERGIALYAVRPPTVPPKEILLRVSLNGTLDRADLDFFLEELQKLKREHPHLFEEDDCSPLLRQLPLSF